MVVLQIRALDKKANKIEKLKNKKGGHNMWNEVHELGQLIRYTLMSACTTKPLCVQMTGCSIRPDVQRNRNMTAIKFSCLNMIGCFLTVTCKT